MLLEWRLSSITLFVTAVHAAAILWMIFVIPRALVIKASPRVVVHTVALNPQKTPPKTYKEAKAEEVFVPAPAEEAPEITLESLPKLDGEGVKAAVVEPLRNWKKRRR